MSPPNRPLEQRTLTDADIDAIVNKAEEVILSRFYRNLGMGLWSMAWRAIVIAVIGIAAYGYLTGRH
jgi:hypothetical protein